MGTGYKSNVVHYRSIRDNLDKVTNEYHYSNGYFGTNGEGRKGYSRHIISENPVKTANIFYKKLTLGGIEKEMPNNKGVFSKMKDGTVVSYREHSTSDGTPVVEINIKNSSIDSGIKEQKIHFVKKEN